MPNKFTILCTNLPNRSALIGSFVAAFIFAANAQTVTVADLLSAQSAKKAAADVTLAPAREKADVWLSAVYGGTSLNFDVVLNGKAQTVTEGQDIKHGKTACTVLRYDPVTRCVAITQAKPVGAICPAKACWTGAPAPEHAQDKLQKPMSPAVVNQLTQIAPINPGSITMIPAPSSMAGVTRGLPGPGLPVLQGGRP